MALKPLEKMHENMVNKSEKNTFHFKHEISSDYKNVSLKWLLLKSCPGFAHGTLAVLYDIVEKTWGPFAHLIHEI